MMHNVAVPRRSLYYVQVGNTIMYRVHVDVNNVYRTYTVYICTCICKLVLHTACIADGASDGRNHPFYCSTIDLYMY